MPLITCPDCDKEHSDAAAACPNCGRPLHATAATQGHTDGSYVTNQGTGKALKLQSLLAWTLIIVGFLIVMGASGDNTGDTMSAGTVTGSAAVLIGLIWWLSVRIKRWWRHS